MKSVLCVLFLIGPLFSQGATVKGFLMKQNFELTSEFEKLDPVYLKAESQQEYLADGTGIGYKSDVRLDGTVRKVIYVAPKDSNIWLAKIFNQDGTLKEKGKYWPEPPGFKIKFKIGPWYQYDQMGKILKSENHDELFKFTLTDVFKFMDENKIPRPELQNKNKDAHLTYYGSGESWIDRLISEDAKEYGITGPVWIINKAVGNGVFQYYLDGKTGKIAKTYKTFAE